MRDIAPGAEIWNSFIKRKIGGAVVGMQYFDGFIWWKHFFAVARVEERGGEKKFNQIRKVRGREGEGERKRRIVARYACYGNSDTAATYSSGTIRA